MDNTQTQPNTLDPSIVALTKAIGQQESGGNYNAPKGADGEYGAYQMTPSFIQNNAPKYLSDYKAGTPLTPAQQDELAYNVIKARGQAGLNPAQIASEWNSGNPNAYKDPNWKGTSKGGAAFNTPKYVQNVSNYYNDFLNKQTPNQGTPISTQPKENFLTSLAKGLIEPVATLAARPIQLGAELLGATPEEVNQATQNIAGDFVAPVPQNAQDVLKDVGRGAQTVAYGLPVGGVADALKLGALAGGGSGLEQSGTLGGALGGAATGAALGGVLGGLGKLLSSIPTRLTESAFKGLTPEEVQTALATKTMGTAKNLIKQSETALGQRAGQIDKLIQQADQAGANIAGDDSIRKTLLQFPEYIKNEGLITKATDLSGNVGVTKMLSKIKSLISNSGGLAGVSRSEVISDIDKIAKGTATLEEKNLVRSAIDNATKGGYTKLAKALSPSAGHDLAMEFANNLRGEIQNVVPDTVPLFQEQAKELALLKAFRQVAGKAKGGLIRWSDIVPFMAGAGIGGLPAGIASAAVNRALSSPATEFAIAKGLLKPSQLAMPVLGRAGLIPGLLKNVSQ